MTEQVAQLPRPALRVVPEGANARSVGFVGRAREIDQLAATYERVRDGQTATVLISGEAGIGKSRLVGELATQAREAGAIAATGCCVRTEDGLPYAPIVGLARDLVRRLGKDAADALAPLVGGVVDAGAAPGGQYAADQPMRHEVARVRFFEAILAGFTELARRAPLVLVVEDLHWADAASVELLDFLTRNLVDAPVLLAATYRAEDADRTTRATLAELARHPRVTALRLGGLTRADITAIVSGRLGHLAEARVADAIWERSQGNPFFAEELAAAPEGSALPADLRDVLVLRIDALPESSRRAVRAAAAIGDAVEHALLAAIGEVDPDVLDTAIGHAVDAHVLLVDDVAAGYRFRHALLREAVYATLLPGERQRLHRAIAQALESDSALGDPAGGKRTALLAAQWWAAGAHAEAFAPSLAAADAAEKALAFRDALNHRERAIAVLDRMPDIAAAHGTTKAAVLERAANLGYMTGALETTHEHATRAVAEYEAAGDVAGVVRSLVLRASYACYVGLGEKSTFADLEEAVRRAGQGTPLAEQALALGALASQHMFTDRYEEGEEVARRALALAREAGARAREAHILNTLGTCLALRGHLDEGVALLRESLDIAEELEDPQAINRGYVNLTHVLMQAGRLAETAAMTFDCAALGNHMWGVRFDGSAGNSIESMVRLGRYQDALDLIAGLGDRALGICVHGPVLWPAPAAVRCGDFERAHHLLAESDRLTKGGLFQDRGRYLVAAADLALVEGRFADAWAHVDEGIGLATGTLEPILRSELSALAVRTLADACAPGARSDLALDAADAATRADAILTDVRTLVAAASRDGGSPSTLLLAFVALAEAERTRLGTSDADRWAAAADSLAVPGLAYETAYARWREAEALLESKAARPRAVDALTAAAATARGLGAAPLLARVEQLAQRARIGFADTTDGTPRVRPGTDLGLTPRELEVLAHLVRGSTDREIADTLFISKKTASVHVSNLLRKLDVANRIEAGKVGQAHGVA